MGFLPDKTGNLMHYPELLGPAVVATKARAEARGLPVHIAPVYADVVRAYEASLAEGG
ncbi:MAG: hypothetical protein R3C52_06900 [Hyphomonadaceae bacterium]